jgi:hypothetical protein
MLTGTFTDAGQTEPEPLRIPRPGGVPSGSSVGEKGSSRTRGGPDATTAPFTLTHVCS